MTYAVLRPDFEVRVAPDDGHRYKRCTRDAGSCSGCRSESVDCMYDCLSLCEICGALEGALLPTCPGRRLSEEEHDANYAHYCAGTGPFAEKTDASV